MVKTNVTPDSFGEERPFDDPSSHHKVTHVFACPVILMFCIPTYCWILRIRLNSVVIYFFSPEKNSFHGGSSAI